MSITSNPSDGHDYLTIVCMHCGLQFPVPVYCGNRFCPICTGPRRRRARDRIAWLIKRAQMVSGYGLSLLTLSIASSHKLQAVFSNLKLSFKKLRKTRFWKRYVYGGVFVIEITHSENGYHPHFHCILSAKYIPYDALRSLWLKISGGTGCHIKRCSKSLAINYLSKYVTKDKLSVEFQLNATAVLKGARLFQPFGSWYHINLTYVAPLARCSDCGATSFYPFDLIYQQQVVYDSDHPPALSKKCNVEVDHSDHTGFLAFYNDVAVNISTDSRRCGAL